jgi:hypothetical protein
MAILVSGEATNVGRGPRRASARQKGRLYPAGVAKYPAKLV